MSELTPAVAAAQQASAAAYSAAERELVRQGRRLIRGGYTLTGQNKLRLAHHVGVERIRNLRGDEPDEWERAGS